MCRDIGILKLFRNDFVGTAKEKQKHVGVVNTINKYFFEKQLRNKIINRKQKVIQFTFFKETKNKILMFGTSSQVVPLGKQKRNAKMKYCGTFGTLVQPVLNNMSKKTSFVFSARLRSNRRTKTKCKNASV